MVIDVLAPLALALVAAAYYRRAATLADRGRPVPGWRQLCFGASVLLLIAADLPPMATLAEDLVVAHMAQHLVIADIAALLVLPGPHRPGPAADPGHPLAGVAAGVRQPAGRAFRSGR